MKLLPKRLILQLILAIAALNAIACDCDSYETPINEGVANQYDFIALVKITDDQDFPKEAAKGATTTGLLTIEIRELFKGAPINHLLEYYKNTSCDLGVSVGEEWVVFGKKSGKQIGIMACDRNVRYKERDGFRNWQYGNGITELRQLRTLYSRPNALFSDGVHKEFYPNGCLELKETYQQGKLNGERQTWYPNGQLYGHQTFKNDSLTGNEVWYYPSGQASVERFYDHGKPSNISRSYYDTTINQHDKQFLINNFYKTEDSLIQEYKRIQMYYEVIYDSNGKELISREYSRQGKISHETYYDHDRHQTTWIYYHKNGLLQSVGYKVKWNTYGHYQEYDENGLPLKSWDYDANGRQINIKMPPEMMERYLKMQGK